MSTLMLERKMNNIMKRMISNAVQLGLQRLISLRKKIHRKPKILCISVTLWSHLEHANISFLKSKLDLNSNLLDYRELMQNDAGI